ncbi:MAG: hypothetical protein Greene041662_45 [Candidatus Peregrinibacteria bacterium Greene0416_62]|nr:MAG: hypothetical protein Greene041662_45 [Candidatus Peregrinibacteria bacterium Greene0416_62]
MRMPPIFFGAISLLLASLLAGVFLLRSPRLLGKSVIRWITLRDIGLVALCNLVIPIVLISEGTRMTTGINTALLLQAEMLFTFLFCVVLFGERMRAMRLGGAVCVFAGTVFILLSGEAQWSTGNILIILATVLYPFGNLISKRLLGLLSVTEILFLRSLFAGVALLILSLLIEDIHLADLPWSYVWWLILVQGACVFFLAKLLWYEGLKVISVSRAVFLVSSSPAFSLFFAIVFLREIPTFPQLIGFVVTMAGVLLLTWHTPKKPSPTPVLSPAL